MTRIAFLITNRLQIFHYKPIADALGEPCTFVIETRDQDFEVDEAYIHRHLPEVPIEWIPKQHLKELDGRFELIVCQTPVLPQVLLDKSLVVAEQYSLAKEAYQYGVWRSLVNLNLMYGPYSLEHVEPFAHAVATGNPLFDQFFLQGAPTAPSGSPQRGLYLPTYGSLSSIDATAAALAKLDCPITVKLHHMESPDVAAQLPPNCEVVFADQSPVTLIQGADFVISDFSGAAFDALYARRPLVLVGEAAPDALDIERLSKADITKSEIRTLAAMWDADRPLADAVGEALDRIADDDAYQQYVDRFYVNHGTAGKACAEAILQLLEEGEPEDFARAQVRTRTRELLRKNQSLRSELAQARASTSTGRAKAGPRSPRGLYHGLRRRVRPALTRHPRLERGVIATKNAIMRLRRQRQINRFAPASATRSAAVRRGGDPADGGYGTTPAEQRRRVAELIESQAAAIGLPTVVEEIEGVPTFAFPETRKREVHQVLTALAADHSDLVVHRTGGDGRTQRFAISELTFGHTFVARMLAVGPLHPQRQTESIPSECLPLLFVRPDAKRRRVLSTEPRAPKVDWTTEFPELLDTAPLRTRLASKTPRHRVGEVDVVYTWVDSSDPEWLRLHAQYSRADDSPLTSANNAERFLDRDELKYSLRSLWMYAPFVRHIYLVTSGQVPTWLDTTSERITVVTHDEIFPDRSVLPVFNSHAIEACLHRIPGLSEHFLYLNDDFFLGRELRIDDFFTQAGLPKVRFAPTQYIYEGEPAPDAIPTDWAAYNATNLVARDLGLRFDRKLQHVPYALKRSTLEELERRYPSEFSRTRAARFRSATDLAVPSMLAHFYGVATGQAVEWPQPAGDYVYVDTGRVDIAQRAKRILDRRPKYFCLNATLHTDVDLSQQALVVKALLHNMYPAPSPFEHS